MRVSKYRSAGKFPRTFQRGAVAFTAGLTLLTGGLCAASPPQQGGCGAWLPLWPGLAEQSLSLITIQQTAAQENALPLTLLFTPQQAGAKFSAKNDPNVALRVLLRDALRESGRYRVLSFQANDPVVVRALREHTLDAADIVEPISPEAMQRIAKAFGARSILSVDATFAHDTLTTQARLLEVAGVDNWHTAYDERTTTPLLVGRKRLKFEEAIAVAADPVVTRLGLPSHVAHDLHMDTPVPIDKPTRKERAELAQAAREQAAQEKKDRADRTRAAHNTANGDGATASNPPDKTNDSVKTGTNSNTTAIHPDPKSPASTGKTAPPVSAHLDNSTFSAFSTDGAAGRDATPARPDVAPPPSLVPTDIEASVARYRQAGDMANVIASLRHAINERPRDPLLRRQLIQAYQDRQMNDAALEETSRALMLLPDDAGLRRLQGDAYLAKGDLPGALLAYRDAIQRDPADIQAQVALADALLADSQFAEAQAAYLAAVKADPKSPLPHRRLANALARRSVGDGSLYATSLDELKQARALANSTDSITYLDDYTALARLMEARLRDLLNELQNDFQAQQQGKITGDALKRALADLKLRSESAADYLDKLPPAPGQDITHAHYQQGAALLLQAVSLFRDYAVRPEDSTLTAMKGAQADAHRELSAGAKSLAARPDAPAKE